MQTMFSASGVAVLSMCLVVISLKELYFVYHGRYRAIYVLRFSTSPSRSIGPNQLEAKAKPQPRTIVKRAE